MTSERLRIIVLFGTLVVFLYLVNTGILSAERIIAEGQTVYLELAPVDPRSLIQGDYMRLDYAIERDAQNGGVAYTHRGQIVARLDENNVAHFVRRYMGGDLAEDEILLNYNTRFGGEDVHIGVDSFLFQEGLADYYARAEYAEVRVTSGGTVMLIDLVGDSFNKLVTE